MRSGPAGPPNRHGAALALFALLLQALLIPVTHRLPPGSLPGTVAAAAMAHHSAHMRADGRHAPDGTAHPDRPAGAKTMPVCPVHLSLQMAGTYLPPPPVVLPAGPPAQAGAPPPALADLMLRRTAAGPQPRAPPLLI